MTYITKNISHDDMMAAIATIGAANVDAPSVDDIFENPDGGNYTPWRMPKGIRSVLVATKVDAGRGPIISWSIPGDYTKTEKVYRMVGDTAQEVFVTDVMGTLIDCEWRPSLRGNHNEPPTNSVIAVCKDGKCLRQLPNSSTGIIGPIYEFSDDKGSRNTMPSKELTSLKWQPCTRDGLLIDLIRQGKSTATVTDKEGKQQEVAFENRGMAYMYVTHVGVHIPLTTDSDGNPVIKKTMNKEQVLANLITTERRVEGKVYKSHSTCTVYHMSELIDENGDPMEPMFLALNMSNSAMKSHYNGGYAGIARYHNAILKCKGLKAPVGRAISDEDSQLLKTINEHRFYNRISGWTTIMTLGMKEVQSGTFYSVPHFWGVDILGTPIYDGQQHATWGDARKIGSLNVDYLSDNLAAKLRYDPGTSSVLGTWDKLLKESGFTTPEEFYLDELVSTPKDYTDVSYTPVATTATVVSSGMKDYFPEEEEDDPYA
jgi:hypothetical protein